MRRVVALIFLIAALFFAWSFRYTYTTKVEKPNIDKMLKERVTKESLNQKIKEALDSEKIDDAESYIELAHYLHLPINKELLQEYKEQQRPIANAMRSVKEFASGFITGKSESGASLGGSVVSDFTVVGDLRDSYKEGSKYLANEPYDKFLLNISLVGLAITASTYATFGATAPVKTGEAVIKSAYKSGKLTKGFTKVLDKKLAQSVDLNLLKQVDFSSFAKMRKSTKAVVKSINPKPLKGLLKELNLIKKNTSLSDSVKLLKYVEREKDLAKITKISAKYKKGTVGVFKLLGKRVLRAGKVVLKYTTKFVMSIIGFVLSIVGFFMTLFSLQFFSKRFI